jgi:hypothetical protein
MKEKILFAALVTIFLWACEKDNTSPNDSGNTNTINGSWVSHYLRSFNKDNERVSTLYYSLNKDCSELETNELKDSMYFADEKYRRVTCGSDFSPINFKSSELEITGDSIYVKTSGGVAYAWSYELNEDSLFLTEKHEHFGGKDVILLIKQ